LRTGIKNDNEKIRSMQMLVGLIIKIQVQLRNVKSTGETVVQISARHMYEDLKKNS
jgi:hypothetical protein